MAFLESIDPRPLAIEMPAGFRPLGLYLGASPNAAEVIVLESPRQPSHPELRRFHAERLGKRAAAVVVVVLWGSDRAAICAPAGGELEVPSDLERSLVERLCASTLACRDRHEALRHLSATLPQLASPLPGLRNSGLFALHELVNGVPGRADWASARRRAAPLRHRRGRDLLEALGYVIQPTQWPVSVLVARERRVAVAVFLDRRDEIDPPSSRFDGNSPVTYALAKADLENLDYVVVLAGPTLRVYPVAPTRGAGRRGRTETYVELDLDLLREQDAGHLWLLASAEALLKDGSFGAILKSSEDYAAALGERLRDRVYEQVIPDLAQALVRARGLRRPSADKLAETYEMALLILFRLLFVAYAEDKDLLPLHTSESYRKHSLKEIAHELQRRREGAPFGREDLLWRQVTLLWKAVEKGSSSWSVPEYDGGLFNDGEDAGAAAQGLARLSLRDEEFGPALGALLLEETAEGDLGPVDFRSLGVREFGTIYEGLLESELSVATADLTVDRRTEAYRPAKAREEVFVPEGRVYLHNASGARKSSGAYYTKPFAVEHLLDEALESGLKDHLERLDAITDDYEAADQFFAFRVADIAMGSGHFLVAAVDRIERRLSNYLAKRPLPGVNDELERLRRTALERLGEGWTADAIENGRLLRRQIARRCIYGVDLNPLAVELARLSLWIHTFVPGLPLSFLDANLVVGNSLVGLATFDEASELIRAKAGDLFSFSATERLGRAREPIERLARLSEATAAEVKEARKVYEHLRQEIEGERDLFTVLAASRVDEEIHRRIAEGSVATRLESGEDVFGEAVVRRAQRALDGLRPLHFPIAFPQVFLGDRGGFDCILGNPPWEEAMCDVNEFWGRYIPGFRGMPQRDQERLLPRFRRDHPDLEQRYEDERARVERLRAFLVTDAYPGLDVGHPDLYKAFCWRFWTLVSPQGGRIGVVLPRSAFSAKGSTEFRKRVFAEAQGVDVTMLLNNKRWVFPEVHPQYTVALVGITRGSAEHTPVAMRGPYQSIERYGQGVKEKPAVFYGEEIETWNDTSSLPLLPTEASAGVFAKLRRSPRLDLDSAGEWRARPIQGDLNATWGKPLMDFRSESCPDGYWPVFKGESFDIWTPDTGVYYAFANPEKVLRNLQERRLSSGRVHRSAFSEFPAAWLKDSGTLPCRRPRVAFRDITNRTNQRTVIVSLVPPNVVLTNKGPYFLWPRGDEHDQAFLLGVLSSLPLDWYARRFVEVSLNFFILNPFPIPRPSLDEPLRLRVIEISGRLASQDRRLHKWGQEVGVKPGRIGLEEQEALIHELDAAVAHLYGLDARDLRHIFETFHEGWDFEDRLRATLRHFAALEARV